MSKIGSQSKNLTNKNTDVTESNNKIQYQNELVDAEKNRTDDTSRLYVEKTRYQMEMYNSVKYLNSILIFVYIVLFIFIHVVLLIQYASGVKRNPTNDILWLLLLFFYIYLIYHVERVIYFAITYVLSFLYGQTYVYQFDKLLLFSDYYE